MRLAPWCSLLLIAACGGSSVSMGTPPGYQLPAGTNPGNSASDGGTTTIAGNSGLPCDVAGVLQAQCVACHSNPPAGGAPMPLVTYADLTAMSSLYPTQTYAQRSLARVQSSNSPMPPGTHMSSSDIAILANWVAAGTPSGTCGSSATDGGTGTTGGPDGVPNSPPQCTSNTYWSGGEGSSRMQPGQACIACHAGGEGPSFSIAGTVYPTTHEPDNCNGTSAVTVEITDASGRTVSLTPNSAGNFYAQTSLAFPIRASVTANGRVRTMVTPQSSGDCNSCHTQSGTQGAPGRIVAP